jgi:Cof subfamily protein (haloacid dehalogenase superfamily)
MTSTFPPDIKLLAVDIDGTIAGHSNKISTGVKSAIAQAQERGVQVAVATGRMYRSALRFHSELNSQLPLVAYQGAWIQNPNQETAHRHLKVPQKIVEQLLDYFEQPELRQLLSVHFYIDDELYIRELTQESKIYAQRSNIKPIVVGDLRQTLERQPTKVLALCDDPHVIDNLLTSLRTQYTPTELYLTKSVATFFEATHPSVNKGAAVKYLAEELLGIKPEQVMTIGDNFNDVEMLQYAGVGVAMGNAPPEVQAIANWVAPKIEEDGVAAAINRFLLS